MSVQASAALGLISELVCRYTRSLVFFAARIDATRDCKAMLNAEK